MKLDRIIIGMSDVKPKRGRPTAAERERRGTRILDAAVAEFSTAGFAGTTLDDIAANAGVTKRTLYVDYGDKSALLVAAVEREHDRIRRTASLDASLTDIAIEMCLVLFSDSAIALHRAVIAEAPRFPELAADFYEAGPRDSIQLLARHLPESAHRDATAAGLYSLLLGERHRRRLLALDPAPSRTAVVEHVEDVLALLGMGVITPSRRR